MQRWVMILAAILAACLSLLAWREHGHRETRGEQLSRLLALQAELNEATLESTTLLERVNTAEAALEATAIEQLGLTDRLANLEAQRDHLRAEAERQEGRARQAEAAIEAAHAEVEQARKELLEQTALPQRLQARARQAEARVAELEEALDRGTAAASDSPELLQVEGVATDGQVVALSGSLPDEASLPLPVYVCQRERVVLEAWIARVEDGIAIAHVEDWRDPASKLVKGEKVFILPRN